MAATSDQILTKVRSLKAKLQPKLPLLDEMVKNAVTFRETSGKHKELLALEPKLVEMQNDVREMLVQLQELERKIGETPVKMSKELGSKSVEVEQATGAEPAKFPKKVAAKQVVKGEKTLPRWK